METHKRLLQCCVVLFSSPLLAFADCNPVITINPNVVNVGLTETLEVKCTFRQRAEQIFESINSITLLHSRTFDKDRFDLLVSVSNSSDLVKGTLLQDPYETSGLINGTGDSYVKICWKNPGKDRAGFYKCEVRMDNVTDGIEPASITMSLQADSPSIDMVLSEMKNIKDSLQDQLRTALSRVNQLQSQISNQIQSEIGSIKDQIGSISSTVNQLQSQISNQIRPELSSLSNLRPLVAQLETQISQVKTYQDILKSNVRSSRKAMFINSSYFMGRYYWLTKSTTSYFSSTYAQATCMTYGGYLAEVNSHDELSFLRSFLRRYGQQCSAVFLGGSDEGHEGTWVNRFSGNHVYPLQWQAGQPDNHRRNEHCLSLSRRSDWHMNDLSCSLTGSDGLGFVCEIPE